MLNEEMSAGTKAEQSTNDETRIPSANAIGNTNVGSSLFPTTQDLFPVDKRRNLSIIDYHFVTRFFGDDEIKIPYVQLYDYLRCVEMLQAAEYQVKSLKEVLSMQQLVTQ